MNRKLVYIFSLIGFFLMWGVFGFAAGAPRSDLSLQATLSPAETMPVVPDGTDPAGIPVTGEPEPVLTEIVVFYGLIGLTALLLILAMLNSANKSTVPYTGHKSPPPDDTRHN